MSMSIADMNEDDKNYWFDTDCFGCGNTNWNCECD